MNNKYLHLRSIRKLALFIAVLSTHRSNILNIAIVAAFHMNTIQTTVSSINKHKCFESCTNEVHKFYLLIDNLGHLRRYIYI